MPTYHWQWESGDSSGGDVHDVAGASGDVTLASGATANESLTLPSDGSLVGRRVRLRADDGVTTRWGAWSAVIVAATDPPPSGGNSCYWGARVDGGFFQSCYGAASADDAPWSGSFAASGGATTFQSHTNKNMSLVHWGGSGSAWPPLAFDTTAANNARSRGMFSQYSFSTSSAGIADILANNANAKNYLGTLATQMKNWGYPIVIRPFWEMNGGWYAWGRTSLTPSQYITLWRNMWQIFADVMGGHAAGSGLGTDTGNVSFFWCPNMLGTGTTADLTGRFPGAAYVDIMGWDGYLGNRYGTTYKTPADHYGPTYDTIAALDASLPMAIGEWAIGHNLSSPGKAGFFTDMLQNWLPSKPRIMYHAYFEDNSAEASADQSLCVEQNALGCPTGVTPPQTAFAQGIALPYYLTNVAGGWAQHTKVPVV